MTKNILAISLAEIKVEQMFNLRQNICNYQQNHLHEEIIKKIMIMKHAYQTDMIDEILLSEMKLRKKIMNDDKNSSEIEENDYLTDEEQKLTKHYHFDYKKTAKKAAKKTTIKKVKKTDQRKYRINEQRFTRIIVSR